MMVSGYLDTLDMMRYRRTLRGRRRQIRGLLVALIALPFAACAERYTPVLSDHAIMPGYSVAGLKGLAGHRVQVEVLGNPFPVPQPAFAGQVAALMDQSGVTPAHFAAHAPDDPATRERVVWNFAPPRESIAPNAICQGKYVVPDRSGVPIDAYAAFCRGAEALSSVRGSLYYADAPYSLEFLILVDAMTTQLFPTDETGPRRSGDARLGKPLSHPF
jgi:hypothetical protein